VRVHNVLDPIKLPIKRNFLYKIVGLPDNETKAIVKLFTGAKLVLNHSISCQYSNAPSFKFSCIFQVYTHNPIENLGRIEKVGKVAIIKQQIESMYNYEALLEKCKNCRQETICSKMLIFESKMF
jgi:hypothetical protein